MHTDTKLPQTVVSFRRRPRLGPGAGRQQPPSFEGARVTHIVRVSRVTPAGAEEATAFLHTPAPFASSTPPTLGETWCRSWQHNVKAYQFLPIIKKMRISEKKKKVKLISFTAVAASLAPESSRQRKPQQIAARYLTPEDAVPATPIRTKAPHFPFRLRRLERVSDWCVCRPTSPKCQKWSKSGDKRCRGSQYVRPNS